MVVSQGDVFWADLPAPVGSGPGFRRPVVIVQGDSLNRSRLGSVVCVPLTGTVDWSRAPGNVLLSSRNTGLRRDSVAQVVHITAIDRGLLNEHVGRLPYQDLERVLIGIDIVLGR